MSADFSNIWTLDIPPTMFQITEYSPITTERGYYATGYKLAANEWQWKFRLRGRTPSFRSQISTILDQEFDNRRAMERDFLLAYVALGTWGQR